MTFRRGLVICAAGAVAVAVALAGLVTYVVVRGGMRAGVAAALRDLVPQVSFVRAADEQQLPGPGHEPVTVALPDAPLGGATGVAQAITGRATSSGRPAGRRCRSTAGRATSPPAAASPSSATRRWTGCTSACSRRAAPSATRSCSRVR